jgi:hypothetical protein
MQLEVIVRSEEMKEDLHEMRRGFENCQKAMSVLTEREKQREREKKQLERDREIREEEKIWSMKRREEREFMRRKNRDQGWMRHEDEARKEDQNDNVVPDDDDQDTPTPYLAYKPKRNTFASQVPIPREVKKKPASPPKNPKKEIPTAQRHFIERSHHHMMLSHSLL